MRSMRSLFVEGRGRVIIVTSEIDIETFIANKKNIRRSCMFSKTIEPRYSETDALGHINNTVLPVWFEFARIDLFKLCHPPQTHHDWPMILAKIDVEYLQQIFYGTEVMVKTYIESIGTKSFVVFQEVWQNDRLAAKGRAVHVWYDYKQQASCPIPDNIRAALIEHLMQN